MWTMKIVWFACLAVGLAEPPPPEGFAGYERGGYEIQTGSTGALQFPGSQEGQQAFGSGQQSGDFPGSSDFSAGGGQGSGSHGQIGGFDAVSGPGFGGFDSSSGQTGSQGQFGGSESTSSQSGSSFGGSNELGQRGSQRFNSGSGSNDGGSNGNNGNDGDDDGDLGDIPGEPGKDYPIYGEIPKTSFRCQQQASPGYFADVETQCQVFHICQKGGQMDSVLCPNGTIFNQKVFVCSWWYDFDCDLAAGLFSRNEEVNAAGESAARQGAQGGQGGARGGEGYSENGPGNGQVAGGYTENGQNNGESSDGYAENGPNNGRITDGFSGNYQNVGGNAQQGNSGGYSDTGSNFENDGGSAQGHFASGGQNGDRNLNEFSGNSIDAFSGYPDNGPDYARTGQESGQNFQNGQNSRGSAKFGQSDRGDAATQGYSDNGPILGQLSGSSDLATSGDHFGNQQAGKTAAFGGNRGGVQSREGGFSSDSNGNGNGLRSGQNEGETASPAGYPSGREGNGDKDFSLPSEGRQSLLDLIGGPSRRESGVEGTQDVPSSEYLPPKEEGNLGQSLGEQDRSYLPPGK